MIARPEERGEVMTGPICEQFEKLDYGLGESRGAGV
jgi:hypothetical protein